MVAALIIGGVLIAVILHECGHALVMRQNSVEIEEFGIGIPIPYLPCLRIKWRDLPTLAFHPILLGAYVKTSEEGANTIESLPERERALISGAGILANIFFSAFLIPFNLLVFGSHLKEGSVPTLILVSLISIFVCMLIWFFRYPFCQYAIPAIGTLLLGVLVFFLVQKIAHSLVLAPAQREFIAGPIGIANIASGIRTEHAFLLVADLSLSIGLFNMMPLLPMDGGRIAYDLVRRVSDQGTANAYGKLSIKVFVLLIAAVIMSDIARAMLR